MTGSAAATVTGLASALPGAQSVWDAPVPLQQANVRVRGAAEDDRLGWSVAGLGDANGDGLADLAVGAPFAANNDRSSSGSAYILYGPFSPTELDLRALVLPGVRIDGATEGDFASGALAAGGDVNADGRADLLMGASETDFNEREQSGSLYVLFGGSHRGEIDLGTLGSFGYRVDGAEGSDRFASSAAGIGDVNGDGRADMLVGAPAADVNDRRNSGSAFLLLGRASAATVDLAFTTPYLRIDGANVDDATGWSVAGAGDVDGDGRRDVIVGAPYTSPNRRLFGGTAYVVFGRQGAGAVVDLGSPGAAAFRIDGPAAGDIVFGGAGWAVAGAGDVNGDGRADVIVGVPFFDANRREDSGSAYVIFGKETPEPIDLASLGARGFRIDGAAAGDLAGGSVASLGDVNADGMADVLVSAEQADFGGDDAGSVYVVYGRQQSTPVDLGALGDAGVRIDGELPEDLAGWSVARAGDVNGDGTQDVLVGAQAWSSDDRPKAGAAYVLYAPNRRPAKLGVVARSPQRVLGPKAVLVSASCDEPCTLRATGRLVAAAEKTSLSLRAASARIATKGQRTLKLTLTAKALARLSALLEDKAKVEATLSVRALDDDGNGSVKTTRIRIKA